MAFPEGYQQWGGTTADFIVSLHQLGAGVNVIKVASAPVLVFNGPDLDSDPVTDLRDVAGEPITTLRSDPSGNLPSFWAPDTATELWVQSGTGGPRLRLITRGEPGAPGVDGRGISGFQLISGNHSPGTVDRYRISMTDSTVWEFDVYNGLDGEGATPPAASTSAAGIAQLATAEEAIGGIVSTKIITPATLASALAGYQPNLASVPVAAIRNMDGTWENRPDAARVIWWDTTGLPPSDPPQFVAGDVILSPGVA